MKNKLFEKSTGWDKSRLTNAFLRENHRKSETAFSGYNAFSMYNTRKPTVSTIDANVYDALMVFRGERMDGAVGLINKTHSVAEYVHKIGVPGAEMSFTETVVFDSTTGAFKSFRKDERGFISLKSFTKDPLNLPHTAFMLAMMPFLEADTEMHSAMKDLPASDSPEAETFDYLAKILLICDNVYRRIEGGIFNVEIPNDGNIWPIDEKDFNNGAYMPDKVIAGTFRQSELTDKVKAKKIATVKDAKAVYWKEKNWTPDVQALVPNVNEKMKVPAEVIELADYINGTSKDTHPARNFMLRGITGYGKSTIVELLGAITNTPVVRISCSPHMETNDFLTNFVPDCSEFTIEENELPEWDDISNDPETAYEMMTGKKKPGITPDECLKVYGDVCRAMANNGPRYKLVESNYVKGLANGWLVEIQEPSVIMNSGVLAGLNEFDHVGSVIPMPDGSYRRRHKDAVVVFTDNVTYEGCRPLNQSVIRRNFMAFDLYDMSKKEILDRVKFNTNFKEKEALEAMYKVWKSIQQYCQENAITDGSISIIELENWAQAMRIRHDFYSTCMRTVISKATAYPDEQRMIVASCLDTAKFPF